jgi:hypothetical protein
VLRIHPEAEGEWLRASDRYRHRGGRAIARQFDQAVLALLRRIEEGPLAFERHGLIAVQMPARSLFFEVRKAVVPKVFPFVIFYYLRNGVPLVLAVAHAKRRPGYWLDRRFTDR